MSCKRYLSQAESNRDAASHLETIYPDWTVTMCFYSALHIVEYYACQKGINISLEFPASSPHDSRRDYVREIANHLRSKDLSKLYNDLEDASRQARYLDRIKGENAKDFFNRNKSKVESSFQKLQRIKDILKIS